jgi:hypothetical protein
MFNRGHSEQSSDSGKRSLAEWLRTFAKELFKAPEESCHAAGDGYAGWNAGMAVAPGVAGPTEAAAFTGQITRLQNALRGVGSEAKSRRAEMKAWQANRHAVSMMLLTNTAPPVAADSHASP